MFLKFPCFGDFTITHDVTINKPIPRLVFETVIRLSRDDFILTSQNQANVSENRDTKAQPTELSHHFYMKNFEIFRDKLKI